MSEQFQFVVYDVIPLQYNVKLLLGVHDNVGLYTMFNHDEVVASNIRKGSTINATEAVAVNEPQATYTKTVNGARVILPYKNPQQEIEIGGNINIVAPVPQASKLVSARTYATVTASE